MTDSKKPAKAVKKTVKKATPAASGTASKPERKTPAKKQTTVKKATPRKKATEPATPETVVRVNDVTKASLRQRMLAWFKSI